MKKAFAIGLLLLCFTSFAVAQDAPANFVGAGAAYNGDATPNVNGWISYGTKIAGIDRPTYSFTTVDITPVRTGKTFAALTTVRTGIAQAIFHQDRFDVLLIGDGGAAATGNNFGYSASAGVGLVYDLGERYRGWRLYAGTKATKTSIAGTLYGNFAFGAVKAF